MYQFDVQPLTQVLHIYDADKSESAAGRTRYTTSMLLTDLGLKECRIHLAEGELNDEINLGVFKLLKAQGYVQAQLEVPAGTNATRLGKYSHTRDGLDRYIVEIK